MTNMKYPWETLPSVSRVPSTRTVLDCSSPSRPAGRLCGAPVWFCRCWPSPGCRPSSPSRTGALRSSRSSSLSSTRWKASSSSWCTASCAERYPAPHTTAGATHVGHCFALLFEALELPKRWRVYPCRSTCTVILFSVFCTAQYYEFGFTICTRATSLTFDLSHRIRKNSPNK